MVVGIAGRLKSQLRFLWWWCGLCGNGKNTRTHTHTRLFKKGADAPAAAPQPQPHPQPAGHCGFGRCAPAAERPAAAGPETQTSPKQ